MSWVLENIEWLFSGIGVAGLLFAIKFMLSKDNEDGSKNKIASNINSNNIVINSNTPALNNNAGTDTNITQKSLAQYKDQTRILFVDDDARFKVSKILVRSGWVHSKLIKDCETLDDQNIVNANILFIDVQGVGVAMGFNDEGLGLALAIKDKYPEKKVVIYSAETQGDRFHEALRKADSFLPKNADPYEFQKLVEGFTVGCED